MFNEKLKEEALSNLEKENAIYVTKFQRVIKDIERLHRSRERAVREILKIERYMKNLANKPRDFEVKINEINIRYTEFNNRIKEIIELDKKNQEQPFDKSYDSMAMLGMGGAAIAPSAAMALAMTFGTASTGTAVASLSGVAATNAALSWLGGGALAIGGAGIAGGQAFLTMAGPVGWAIGGVSIASGALLKAFANKDVAKKAEEATVAIKKERERISETDAKICEWNKETIKLMTEISKKIFEFRMKKDYENFSEDEKKELIVLLNMTELLSTKIGETIDG